MHQSVSEKVTSGSNFHKKRDTSPMAQDTQMVTDIAIVGGGIAGAALACALHDREYHVTVVERRSGPLDTARGDHLSPRNVELLADWGALDAFLNRGAGKRTRHEFRKRSGEVLLSASYDELPIPFPHFLVIDHDRIAEILLELADESDSVHVLRPASLRALRSDRGVVRSLMVILEDGSTIDLRPRIVVGADGVSSTVRRRLEFPTDEYAYRHPMVALFGSAPAQLQPPETFFRYSSEEGMLVIQRRMDPSIIKVTLPVGPEGTIWWKNSSSSERAELLARRADVLADFESEIAGFYPIRMIHARRYAKGNAVLIGDAAHSIHPARGQGLNLGIYSLRALLDHLPPASDLAGDAQVREALARYNDFQRPLFGRILGKNHAAALAMEASAEGYVGALMVDEEERLLRIDRDPRLRRQHLLEVTGYSLGIDDATSVEPDGQQQTHLPR